MTICIYIDSFIKYNKIIFNNTIYYLILFNIISYNENIIIKQWSYFIN